jgi:hypothetical protein
MAFLDTLFTHSFSVKTKTRSITNGEVQNTVAEVTGLKGRFEPITGDRIQGLLGKAKQATLKLYTRINANIKVGSVIIRTSDSSEYDVIAVNKYETATAEHHLEVFLEVRGSTVS